MSNPDPQIEPNKYSNRSQLRHKLTIRALTLRRNLFDSDADRNPRPCEIMQKDSGGFFLPLLPLNLGLRGGKWEDKGDWVRWSG